MVSTLQGNQRSEETFKLQGILGIPETPSSVYSEAEACYIMWHVFHAIHDCNHFLSFQLIVHASHMCHLDIRPDNIYLTSDG